MNGDLNVTGKYLSGGIDLATIFSGGSESADRLISGSESLVLNPNGSIDFPNDTIRPPDETILTLESENPALSSYTRVALSPYAFFAYDNEGNSITFDEVDNAIVLTSQDEHEWTFNKKGVLVGPHGALTVNSLSSLGRILSGDRDLADIFLTSETDSQTLTFTESSAELSISNGNTVILSALSGQKFDQSLNTEDEVQFAKITVNPNQGPLEIDGTGLLWSGSRRWDVETGVLNIYDSNTSTPISVIEYGGNADSGSTPAIPPVKFYAAIEMAGDDAALNIETTKTNLGLGTADSVEFNQVNANVYLSGGTNLLNILSSSGGGGDPAVNTVVYENSATWIDTSTVVQQNSASWSDITLFSSPTGYPYTIQLLDRNKLITVDSSTNTIIRVPDDNTYNIDIGAKIEIVGLGTGRVTILGLSGVEIKSVYNANRLKAQHSTASVLKLSANTWLMQGDLLNIYNTPADITGLQLWLDASDSSTLYDSVTGGSLVGANGTVARWEDKTSNANHATQSTVNNRPIRLVSNLNGLDGLDFDGTNDSFVTARPVTDSPCTIFVVAAPDVVNAGVQRTIQMFGPTAGQNFMLMFSNAGTYITRDGRNQADASTTTQVWGFVTANTPYIKTAIFRSTNTTSGYLNNLLGPGTVTSLAANAGTQTTIGARNDFLQATHLNGKLYEILVYNKELTDAERVGISNYLSEKWNIFIQQ